MNFKEKLLFVLLLIGLIPANVFIHEYMHIEIYERFGCEDIEVSWTEFTDMSNPYIAQVTGRCELSDVERVGFKLGNLMVHIVHYIILFVLYPFFVLIVLVIKNPR